MQESARRRSRTWRAMGPLTLKSCAVIAPSSGGSALARGTRPSVVRSEAMPQHWAGQRKEPP